MKPPANGYLVLLRAAATLGAEFTEAALAVAAWTIDPAGFGLPGFEAKHPAQQEVRYRLLGARGLVGRGWMEQIRTGVYRLTAAGSAAARDGPGPQTRKRAERTNLPRPRSLAPATMATVDRLLAGRPVGPAELSDLALVHRFLGEFFARKMKAGIA